MAKKSMLGREAKRTKLRALYQHKRAQLKLIVNARSASMEEKWAAQLALQRLPRNASPVRMQRRCALTGRPHAVYRRFGLCRNKLREHAMFGDIPGIQKSSW